MDNKDTINAKKDNIDFKQRKKEGIYDYSDRIYREQHIDELDEDSSFSERTPNDDRSDAMNPNNQAYQDSMDNRSVQLNRK